MTDSTARIRMLQRLKAERRARQPARIDFDVPRTFLGFCEWLGVQLTAGQAVLCGVLYDGAIPVDRDLARQMFGDIDFENLPLGSRSVVAIVAGARGGKSYIAISLRLLHAMLVSDLQTMAPGQRAVALNIAPNEKLRREVLNYARGAVRSKSELEAMVVEDTADGFGLRRPDGHVVKFETGVATAGGYGGRGRSLVAFALDESAFFRDSSFKVNDVEVFRAGTARVLPGGQTIIASTPWAKTGLLYELYRDNWGKPTTAIAAHAPTLVLHDSPMTRAIVERERLRDPDNAAREFDAQFVGMATSVFFSDDLIDAAVDDDLPCGYGESDVA